MSIFISSTVFVQISEVFQRIMGLSKDKSCRVTGVLLGKRLQEGYLITQAIQINFKQQQGSLELDTQFLPKEEKNIIEQQINIIQGKSGNQGLFDTYADHHYIGWFSVQEQETQFLNDYEFHHSNILKYDLTDFSQQEFIYLNLSSKNEKIQVFQDKELKFVSVPFQVTSSQDHTVVIDQLEETPNQSATIQYLQNNLNSIKNYQNSLATVLKILENENNSKDLIAMRELNQILNNFPKESNSQFNNHKLLEQYASQLITGTFSAINASAGTFNGVQLKNPLKNQFNQFR